MAVKAKFQKSFLFHLNHLDVVNFQNSFPMQEFSVKVFLYFIPWIYMYKVLELILMKSVNLIINAMPILLNLAASSLYGFGQFV